MTGILVMGRDVLFILHVKNIPLPAHNKEKKIVDGEGDTREDTLYFPQCIAANGIQDVKWGNKIKISFFVTRDISPKECYLYNSYETELIAF